MIRLSNNDTSGISFLNLLGLKPYSLTNARVNASWDENPYLVAMVIIRSLEHNKSVAAQLNFSFEYMT